jgi:hypothetical protein
MKSKFTFWELYKMPLEEYEWAVNEMMKDNAYLYNSMIKDLYFLGVVLEKKYRLLRITYNIFMIGIIISVIAFVVALIQFGFSPPVKQFLIGIALIWQLESTMLDTLCGLLSIQKHLVVLLHQIAL